jgi:preprotein translocase subunit YajC
VQLIVMLVLLGLAWAFVILPQQRRVKAHRAFVDALSIGDEVVTTAGVHGTIVELHDDTVRLRIAPEVDITLARLAVGRPQPSADVASAPVEPATTEPTEPGTE